MHLGRFHRAVELLNSEYMRIRPDTLLQDIIGKLNAVAANPGNADVATNFKSSLETCRQALASSPLNYPRPILQIMLESIDAQNYVGEKMFSRIKAAIEADSAAPALVVQALTKLQQSTQSFYQSVAALDKAFSELQVEYSELEDGEAELGLLIPRQEGASTLQDLAREFREWHTCLSPIVEVFDANAPPLQIKICSTTDWTLFLAATPPILVGVSFCLKKVNEILRETIEMRSLLEQLAKRSSSKAVAELEAEADSKLQTDLRKLAESIVDERLGELQEAQKNDLKNRLAYSLKTVAHKVTTGVKVEVRLLPPRMPADSTAQEDQEKVEQTEPLAQLALTLDQEVSLLAFDENVKSLQTLLPAPEANGESPLS